MTIQFVAPTKRRKSFRASVEKVRALLDYAPETGVLTWRVRRAGKATKGARAGSQAHWNGYRVLSLGGTQYQEHAVAWAHFYGSWPTADIDHINGDRADNRIGNLRECTAAENAQNVSINRDNKSGFLGVYFTAKKRWRAQIKKDGVRHYLGDFDTPLQAHEAYLAAKAKLHPFNPVPRRGRKDG